MLEPSPILVQGVPSAFLPHLPRAQSTLSPLSCDVLLGHLAVLRGLYLPPIHGGFHVVDIDDLDDDDEPIPTVGDLEDRSTSAGLAESMDGLGLEFGWPTTRLGARGSLIEEEEEDTDLESLDEEEDRSTAHLDPFEREWAERWLNGVVRRAQSWLEEREGEEELPNGAGRDATDAIRHVEAVLRDATAVLAMMAGTSAAGSLTRHLLFPVDPTLSPAVRQARRALPLNPDHSPETTTFLASLSMSPVSPLTFLRRRLDPSMSLEDSGKLRQRSNTGRSFTSDLSTSPDSPFSPNGRRKRKRRPAIAILLHDASMADHLSVGVQTWGSAILLGREMAKYPAKFGLLPRDRGVRILELGAGTGLQSILCRKLLDLHHASAGRPGEAPGLVVATDFHPDVLANLKVCVDLNFPPLAMENGAGIESTTDLSLDSGIHIAKLDWGTFPANMTATHEGICGAEGTEEVTRFLDQPFDLVLASDCVYDPTHAAMLRQVASWVLRPPVPGEKDHPGGDFSHPLASSSDLCAGARVN